MVGLVTTMLVLCGFVAYWVRTQSAHQKRIDHLPIRVHVNGIRGKSTVTRLVAGVLREGGFETVAKTTGSAARIIFADGNEEPLRRRGAPTIVEQIEIIKNHVLPTTQALVIECMAVNPIYQEVSQEKIVKGNITVITNVREDHQDVMGESLEEIADSLATTIPRGGLLITGEERGYLRDRLERNARAKGTRFIYADREEVKDEDLRHFGYLSFKENIAIGLTLARMLDIPREVALRGMVRAIPDIGAVFVQKTVLHGKELVWAPLFAVNDRESTVIGIDALRPYHRRDATRIGVLNNRYDRGVRALQFAEIAARDLDLDHFVTFGAYEDQVTARMVEHGFPRTHIHHLGFSVNPTLAEILSKITNMIDGPQGVLIGLVNIHTPQAELLMEFFHHLNEERDDGGELVADMSHIPESAQRLRYLIGRLLRTRA